MMFELPVEITQDMLDIQRQKLLSVIKDHGNSVEKGRLSKGALSLAQASWKHQSIHMITSDLMSAAHLTHDALTDSLFHGLLSFRVALSTLKHGISDCSSVSLSVAAHSHSNLSLWIVRARRLILPSRKETGNRERIPVLHGQIAASLWHGLDVLRVKGRVETDL